MMKTKCKLCGKDGEKRWLGITACSKCYDRLWSLAYKIREDKYYIGLDSKNVQWILKLIKNNSELFKFYILTGK